MYTLKVDGMSCNHCKQTITNAIQSIDAEAKVQVDLAQAIVNVQSHAARDSIRKAIEDSGFDVLEAQASAGH